MQILFQLFYSELHLSWFWSTTYNIFKNKYSRMAWFWGKTCNKRLAQFFGPHNCSPFFIQTCTSLDFEVQHTTILEGIIQGVLDFVVQHTTVSHIFYPDLLLSWFCSTTYNNYLSANYFAKLSTNSFHDMNAIGIFLLILNIPSLRVQRITSNGTLALIIDLLMEGRVFVLASMRHSCCFAIKISRESSLW